MNNRVLHNNASNNYFSIKICCPRINHVHCSSIQDKCLCSYGLFPHELSLWGCWYSPLPFLFILFGLLWILAASLICLVRGSLKYPHALMLNENVCPLWSLTQWLHNADSLALFSRALRCSSPLECIFRLVSQWYSAPHYVILYPTFFLRQFPSPLFLHEKHIALPQVFPVHGLDLESWEPHKAPEMIGITLCG